MSSMKQSKTSVFTLAFAAALTIYKISKKEVAEKTGIFTGRISEYALGKTDPSLENIIKIANSFGLDIVDFLALGHPEGPKPQPAAPPLTDARELELYRRLAKKDDEIETLKAENARLKSAKPKAARRKTEEPDFPISDASIANGGELTDTRSNKV